MDILGKRFEFVGQWAGEAPDFMVIAIERVSDDCYVHSRDGRKQHLSLSQVEQAIRRGNLHESVSPPFYLSPSCCLIERSAPSSPDGKVTAKVGRRRG